MAKPRFTVFTGFVKADSQRAEDLRMALLAEPEFTPWSTSARADVAVFILSKSITPNNVPPYFSEQVKLALRELPKNHVIPVSLDGETWLPPGLDAQPTKYVQDQKDDWTGLIDLIRRVVTYGVEPVALPDDELVEACANGDCTLFAGAGISAPDFPLWEPLVSSLIEAIVSNGSDKESLQHNLLAAVDAGNIEFAIDVLVAGEQYDRADLIEAIRPVFAATKPQLQRRHELLQGIPFAGVITTTFDPLMKIAFAEKTRPVARKPGKPEVLTHVDSQDLLMRLARRKYFFGRLYGELDKPDTVLLSRLEYERAVLRNPDLSGFIGALFCSKTALFMGCSLDGIIDYLRALTFPAMERKHYAVASVLGRSWTTKAQYLRNQYNINVIPYVLQDGHAECASFTEELYRRVRTRIATPACDRIPSRPFLKSAILENIGPFEKIEFSFDDRLNILLGDNACGKSLALRAVGLGLWAEDGPNLQLAGLIRSGCKAAKITLESSAGLMYHTALVRQRDTVYLHASPRRMLLLEGWLVLGLPAIRSFTPWQPSGPALDTNGHGRSMRSDLSPLLAGEHDSEVDSTKQWLVNLDYYRHRKNGKQAQAAQRQWDLLWETWGVLLDIPAIQGGRIDPKSSNVIVNTADGPLPLELLSLGTMSMLGFVGRLVCRMCQFYHDSEKPLDETAIVLIDEIDAHLHPSWQVTIMDRLLKLFPRIQFIGATHSHYIVGGRPPECLFRLRRPAPNLSPQLDTDIPPGASCGTYEQVATGPYFECDRRVPPFALSVHAKSDESRMLELEAKHSLTDNEREEYYEVRGRYLAHLPARGNTYIERCAHQLLNAILKARIPRKYDHIDADLADNVRHIIDAVKHSPGGDNDIVARAYTAVASAIEQGIPGELVEIKERVRVCAKTLLEASSRMRKE